VAGRKYAEVAGRTIVRGAGVGLVSNVEATRPVAVAGRVGGLICGGFLAPLVPLVGLSKKGEALGFRGCGFGMVVARARDTAGAPCVPFVVRPVRWVVCGALADVLGASLATRSPAKGLGSSANV
jgi:hypothetical protein